MPLNRYQIRNEYSLADPELYKAADKDDPEALLEGVAMAGLVGVLRQLGDLAEFAAEIFHDLHEEVMATATRGHSLMVRVKQLEAEFPLIERAFLSQTNHSSFFYNAGTDWHPNLRIDQNMVTRGDLPRFVMDSYEECRGPPRLFLLDKFDVACAGACLKRYTDPSSFKVETSSYAFTTSDVQRERRTRKTKKRGPRWRNGETPEVLPSHAKLHQLFLEERIENGINVPAHRVKLKRKLNGFPFDLKTGKSYMNKFLEVSSPEHKVVHEVGIDSSPLRLPSTDAYETLVDTEDIRPPSPDKEVMQRNKRASLLPSPPLTEENSSLRPCLDEVNQDLSHCRVRGISRQSHKSQSTDILPSIHSVVDEKEVAVDGESQTERGIGYESDDVASEIDNYVDALTTMEPELETDSEQRARSDLHFLNSKKQVLCLSSSSEKLRTQSSDSHSIENSTLSDDGNSYSKKEISSFSCSDSPSTSVESVLMESEISSKGAKTFDTSCEQQSVNVETQLPQPPEHGVYDRKSITVAREPSSSCDSGEQITTLNFTDSTPMPIHAYTGTFVEVAGMRAETNENFVSHGKSENPLTTIAEDASSLHVSLPYAPVILDAPEQNGDDSPSRASIDVKLTDDLVDRNLNLGENVACASSHSDVSCHARDNMLHSKSPEIQHESSLYNDDVSLVNNLPFTSELLNIPSEDSHEVLSSDYQQLLNLDGEDPSSGDDLVSLYNLPNRPSSKEGDTSSLLAVNHPNHVDGGLDNENSNGSSVASVQILDILGASDKECGKHSWFTMSHDKTAEDTCMKPHNVRTKDTEAGDADEEHEETSGAFSDAARSEPGDLSKCCGGDGLDFVDVLNPQISEIATDIQPLESGELDISCSRQENPVEVLSLTKFDDEGSIAPNDLFSGIASTGSLTSPHLKSPTSERILSDETENKIDKSDVTDETALPLAALVDKENFDDLHSSLDHKIFSEGSVCLIGNSSENELEIDLPDSDAVSKFKIQIADSPDSNSFVLDTSNCHHPESAVLDTPSGSKLSFDAGNTVNSNTAPSQPPLENWCLHTEEVSSQRSVADSTEDASSLQISLEKGKDELEDNQPNEELLHKAHLDQSPSLEKMQSHVNRASDAYSQSFLANLPSQDAVPDVLAHSSNQVPQPLLTDYCAEERAKSFIHEQVKREVMDSGEAKSEPLPLITQPQLVDCFDIEQSAEASSVSSQRVGPSHPPFPELLSQSNQDSMSSLYKKDEETACKEPDKERLIDEDAAKEVLLPEFEETCRSNHVDIVGALNASSIPFTANAPSGPAVSNSLPLSSHNVNPFENGNISTPPGFALLPDEPQISLAEVPPLPPLPPIQWRMGKLHSSPDLDVEPTKHYIGANPSSLASRTDQNSQPVNQNMPSAVATESPELIDVYSADSMVQSGLLTLPPTVLCENSSIRCIDPVHKHSTKTHFPLASECNEVRSTSLHATRSEAQPINWIPDVTSLDKPSIDGLGSSEQLIQRQNQVAPELLPEEQGSAEGNLPLPVSDGIKPIAPPTDTVITDSSESLFHEPSHPQHHPLHQLAPEACLNSSNLEETLTSLEKNVVTHGTVIPSYTEHAKPDHRVPTTEAEIIWPAVEEGNTNEIRPVKLQRPRTPLIDDLAAHDKSKLRKVTGRVRPEIQKVDERDSLLQLRKVTERSRPEIQKVDERDSLVQLRKVTERVMPEIQKVDDRDSLLEQIRKKSFNLKPTVATRPSIQGPQTNLRVAAILEKAKTIRQAFAGSDEEDDEDSWSDT